MSFPSYPNELICVFSLCQIHFLNNFSLAVSFSLWIHTGMLLVILLQYFPCSWVLCPSVCHVGWYTGVSREPGRHSYSFLILPTVIFLLCKAPHNLSEVRQDLRAEPVLSNESVVWLKEFVQTIRMILFVPVLLIGLFASHGFFFFVLFFLQESVENGECTRYQLSLIRSRHGPWVSPLTIQETEERS